MDSIVNSQSLLISQKALDALWLKQQVISNNIANVDTPGYKSLSVEFEDMLSRAIKSSQLEERLSTLEPKVVENNTTTIKEDGNNVDIDEQNIELTKAELQYQGLARVVTADLARLQYAISGGRG